MTSGQAMFSWDTKTHERPKRDKVGAWEFIGVENSRCGGPCRAGGTRDGSKRDPRVPRATRKELLRRQTKKAARFNGRNSDGRFSKEGTQTANERMRKVLTVVSHSKRQSKPGNAASPPPPPGWLTGADGH